MKAFPTISIIIPTHNRRDSLLRLLHSVELQAFDMDRLQVIVVDDGSTDDTSTIATRQFPFAFRYLQQKNQGATAARNYGAKTSQSEILVFIDDDMTISPHTLEAFAEKFDQLNNILLMGTINTRSDSNASVYTSVALTMSYNALNARDDVELNSVDCNTELLACRRRDFFEIGMFQDPTGGNGWPNWDDVDFGYRAHLKGFRILGASNAVADHWDYSISSRVSACHRFYRAARSAVWLFEKHPELQALIPMLYDKTPPVWGQDPLRLITRKFARHVTSSPPVLHLIEKLVNLLERQHASPIVLGRLYKLLHGANMFRGYRAGLREFKLVGVEE